MPTQTDIRVLIPRVRRAVEGPVPVLDALTDAQVRDIVADSLADLMLYSGSVFGKQLVVTATDADTNSPLEYATSDALTLQEGSVVAAQAALNTVYFKLAATKTSEKISDEAQSWEYTTSANLLRDLLAALKEARDKALAALESSGPVLESYESFLAVRDVQTARYVEPWGQGYDVGGLQNDYRFGQ